MLPLCVMYFHPDTLLIMCYSAETHQDVLNLVLSALDMVKHHVLKDVLAILELVHFIISICVEH